MNRFHPDRENAGYAKAARAVVATAFVMGLTALVWVHVDFDHASIPIVENAIAPKVETPGDAFLRAPADDPSVPKAASLFRDSSASTLDVPPVPSF